MEGVTHTDVRKRYLQKIALCEGIDPYKVDPKDMSRKYEDLPNICYMNLFNYFVLTSSYYSNEEMSAFKSLEAYKQFASGFVKNVLVKRIPNDKRIIVATVNHSMRLSLPPLKPWILCKADGNVLVAHCTCLAGLGEVCSHAAAALYVVESMVRSFSQRSKTDVLCQWNHPTQSSTGIIKNTQIRHLDFTIKERRAQTHSFGLQPFTKDEIFDLGKDLKERTERHSTLSMVTNGLNDEFSVALNEDLPEYSQEITVGQYKNQVL